jgi:cyclic pyranopterin phosphate synthase
LRLLHAEGGRRDYQFLEREQLLSFEEIARLAPIFVAHGVQKIRLTGGEPLVRRDLEWLVEMLARIRGLDLTLTTNGSLLAKKAQALKDAGLKRVTVSLDSLDNEVFMAMNDVDFPVEKVIEGIEAAANVGLAPIKINMVVKRGVNEQSILPMARYFRGTGHILRFIEYMDVGHTNGWRLRYHSRPRLPPDPRRNATEPVSMNYHGESPIAGTTGTGVAKSA